MQCLKTTCYFIERLSQTLGYAKNLNVVSSIKSTKSQQILKYKLFTLHILLYLKIIKNRKNCDF